MHLGQRASGATLGKKLVEGHPTTLSRKLLNTVSCEQKSFLCRRATVCILGDARERRVCGRARTE